MKHNKHQSPNNIATSFTISKGKLKELVIAGLLATIAFDLVMYVDITITGLPLEIPSVLGDLALDESLYAEPIGRLVHLGNGIGIALLFGFIAFPISRRLTKLPAVVYGVAFAVIELVIAVWFGMLPALGTGVAGFNIGPEVAAVTLLRYIAFGAVLGISVRRWKY